MVKSVRRVLAACALTAASACGGGGGGAPAPAPPSPAPPPPAVTSFSDVTSASGIEYAVGITLPAWEPISEVDDSTFGGAAAGDCDGDGDIDLFITYGDAGPNRLYLNQLAETGNGLSFVDDAAAAGVAYTRSLAPPRNDRHSGPTFADLDGDGDLDLFLGGIFRDPNKIYRNDGNCTFTDVTANSPELVRADQDPAGEFLADHTMSAAFGDYDLDGDLDMFLTHWGTPDDLYLTGRSEHLWENVSDDDGIRFVNVSAESNATYILFSTRNFLDPLGRLQQTDFTFTPTFARVNDDVWPDIAIAGDFATSQLLLNNGDGTFADQGTQVPRNAQYGMGQSLGDYDNDGDLDWFVTSIRSDTPTTTGNRLFEVVLAGSVVDLRDRTTALGVADGGWGWASCFVDVDNDGDLDIYHTNGWHGSSVPADDPGVLFVNNGGRFTDEAPAFGLDDPYSGRGIVCADFDEDGDIDILQLTDRQPSSGVLWENRTAAAGNNYLRVKLNGLAPNTEAAGARIYLTIGGQTQMREVMIGSNFTSQNPAQEHFGLGPASVADQVRVVWPARVPAPGQPPVQPADSVLTAVGANQTLVIPQPP